MIYAGPVCARHATSLLTRISPRGRQSHSSTNIHSFPNTNLHGKNVFLHCLTLSSALGLAWAEILADITLAESRREFAQLGFPPCTPILDHEKNVPWAGSEPSTAEPALAQTDLSQSQPNLLHAIVWPPFLYNSF